MASSVPETNLGSTTHRKAVMKRPTRMDAGFAYPPYPALVQKVIKTLTRW